MFNINNNLTIVDENETYADNPGNTPQISASESVIFINGSDLDNDWDDCVAISGGSGSHGDPYIIQNGDINASSYEVGIHIENSNEYFEIKNCSVEESQIGIKLDNVSNGHLYNLSISNLYGKDGLDGNNGYTGAGIYLNRSSNNNLEDNIISNITGGNGGNDGGSGGEGAGIYLANTSNNYLVNNKVSNITGGNGGGGGYGKSSYGGDGGSGGKGAGFSLIDSSLNVLIDNTMENITCGIGGETNGYYSGYNGNGRLGAGAYFNGSFSNILENNDVTNIKGGKGTYAEEGHYGKDGGDGAGIYLAYSSNYIIIGTYDGFFHILKDIGSASELKLSDRTLDSLYDDLGKGWWNYIRLKDFGFLDHITNLKDISISEGDILIHKEIKRLK